MDIQEELKKYFPQMEKQLNKEELEDFIHSEYKDLSQFHFGMGRWIRNRLLKENSTLYQLFKINGAANKDDMSQLMIKLFYIYLQNKYKQP